MRSRSNASPRISLTRGKRCAMRRANSGSYSMAVISSGETPRSMRAWVATPVPGPISRMAPFVGIWAAMALARARLDGAIAPTSFGFATRRPMKRRLSDIAVPMADEGRGWLIRRQAQDGGFVDNPQPSLSNNNNLAGSLVLRRRIEETLGLGQPAFACWIAAHVVELVEFAQQLLLPLAQFDRRFDGNLDIEIAMHAAAAQNRHALAAQAELTAGLRTLGQRDFRATAVKRRNFDRAAERGEHERHRGVTIKIVAIALEHLVRLDRYEDVEIARRSAIHARLAFA